MLAPLCERGRQAPNVPNFVLLVHSSLSVIATGSHGPQKGAFEVTTDGPSRRASCFRIHHHRERVARRAVAVSPQG
jgi:hypothetical protein